VEELGGADLGVSVVIAQTLKIAQTLQLAASPEQRDRFLPAFAADPRFLLAIGITEPENASNYLIPYPEDFRTTATRVSGCLCRRGVGWLSSWVRAGVASGPDRRWTGSGRSR